MIQTHFTAIFYQNMLGLAVIFIANIYTVWLISSPVVFTPV